MGLIRGPLPALAAGARREVLAVTACGAGVVATSVGQAVIVARIVADAFRGRYHQPAPLYAALVALVVVRLALVRAEERRATALAAGLRRRLRGRLYAALVQLGPAYLLGHGTGEVQSTMVDGVESVAAHVARFLPLVVVSAATVTGVVVAIAVLDPVTGGAVLACAALVPAAPVLTERAFGESARAFWTGFGRLSSGYLDAIVGMPTLQAFGAQRRWGDQLADRSRDLSEDAIGLNALASMHIGFVSLGVAAGTAGAVALAALRVTQGRLGLTAGLTVMLLARECFRPLSALSRRLPRAYVAVAAGHGIAQLLEAQPDIVEDAHPTTVDRATFRPSLAFDDVTFSYRPGGPPALDGLTFTVEPGETVALVGRSGAGKTTVVSLLLRFFDPRSGSVRVGGHDVRHLGLAPLRELFAVSFQDTYLFDRSIGDNLLLGRPGATAAEVEAAAVAAHAHGFISQLPDGYATVVAERGMRLSGGERQRIAIARAVLADRPFLVLDEPTSSVDGASEALIRDALERVTVGRTTLIIAHRLSTVEGADRVLVLDRGRVVEGGAPAALLAAGGAYARLVRAQGLA